MKTSGVIAALLCGLGLTGGASAQDADPISESAAVYMTYQLDVDDMAATPFKSAEEIDSAVARMGAYNADQLSRGWMSYSALIASQDKDFATNVRKIEAHYGRGAVMKSFAAGDGYARSLEGGDDAVGAAIDATEKDVARLQTAADVIFDQGYSLQQYGWAKSKFSAKDKVTRATKVVTLRGQGRLPDSGIVGALTGPALAPTAQLEIASGVTNVVSAIRLPQISALSRRKPSFQAEGVANRMASLAALRILGTSDVDQTKLSTAMLEPAAKSCINMENLQFDACVANQADAPFVLPQCISRHTVTEVGGCLAKVYK